MQPLCIYIYTISAVLNWYFSVRSCTRTCTHVCMYHVPCMCISNYSPPARPPPNINDITIELEQLCIDGKVSHSYVFCSTHSDVSCLLHTQTLMYSACNMELLVAAKNAWLVAVICIFSLFKYFLFSTPKMMDIILCVQT